MQEAWSALLTRFGTRWKAVAQRMAAEPQKRTVTTRWGDAVLLTDFHVTRVGELAVHGLDLAEAPGVRPWLTEAASDIVEGMTLPSGAHVVRPRLGWDRRELLRKATGRTNLTDEERSTLHTFSVS